MKIDKIWLYVSAFCILSPLLFQCKSANSTMKVSSLKNFNADAKEHILFLTFKISDGEGAGKEKVILEEAVSGSGRLKNLNNPSHNPYQIRVLPRYSINRLELAMEYDHPLYVDVEVPSASGPLTKHQRKEKEGRLYVRIPYETGLSHIELYSILPEKSARKIYTLKLTP